MPSTLISIFGYFLALHILFHLTTAKQQQQQQQQEQQEEESHGKSTPNILLIMMDDLGFTDTSLNGGDFPTSTLNSLSSNGIKLNYHYSNTLCSASRSSLLSGRYAWRTGIVKIVKPLTLQHTMEDIPFISEKLKNNDPPYKTAMFGKFHLGYSSPDYLPFNRGFDKTLFFESGAVGYRSHKDCSPWYWALQGIPIEPETRGLLMKKFIDGFCSYDLWDEHYNKIENIVYSEKLYTDHILKYIDNIEKDPFFIYYAMQTPHWPLESPPKLYDECNHVALINAERKLFCNSLLYGDEMIGRIVDSLKEKELWDDTVLIFLSDNGPNTNWGTKGFGQTLPLRGAKGSTFEGGIRTPGLVSGGYVERHCVDIGRSYNDMVHISDWYPMIEHIVGIKRSDDDDNNYDDIDGINLWGSICGDNDNRKKREEIMHFSMSDANDIEQGYGPSYIRTDEWKLTINASFRVDGNIAYKYWVNYDNTFTPRPTTKLYRDMVDKDEEDLYESQCVNNYMDGVPGTDGVDFDKDEEDLYESQCVNNYMDGVPGTDGVDFDYDEIMLFKISEDKVEGCNVAKYYPKIVSQLMKKLFSDDNIEQYVKYEIYKTVPSKQGALAQIESYDCDSKTSYHLSWNKIDKYSEEHSVELSWDDIFNLYVDIVDECNVRNQHKMKLIKDAEKQQNSNDKQKILLILIIWTVILLIVLIKYYLKNKHLQNKDYQRKTGELTDITPLLL